MLQLILHLFGDYILQSDWMAQNKTKCSKAAAAHAITYSLPFLLLQPSWEAFAVILVTHFLIDRFRLARYVVMVKNVLLSPNFWRPLQNRKGYRKDLFGIHNTGTGYPADAPPWLAVWLLIAADNTLHLAINYAALRWL